MRFKRSANLTVDQFAIVFKLFLYRVITGVIFFSLVYVILRLGLSVIMRSNELSRITSLIGELFRTLISGDVYELLAIRNSLHNAVVGFVQLVGEHIDSIALSVVGVAAMYLLARFANGLALFTVGSTLNDRMSAYARTSFSAAFFKNLGKAAIYQVVYVPLAFVYDALSLLACWFFFFFIPSLMPIWGAGAVLASVSLTLTAVFCLQALKLTIVSSWMPSMIADGLSVGGALKGTGKHFRDFGRRYAGFLVAVYLIVFVNVGFALFTVGSGLLLSVPTSFVFLLSMQFVNYYESTGKKYFVSRDVIASADDDKAETAETKDTAE